VMTCMLDITLFRKGSIKRKTERLKICSKALEEDWSRGVISSLIKESTNTSKLISYHLTKTNFELLFNCLIA
jgi:hypothetical protein